MEVKRSHRPLIIGKNGAVATNHPVATQAGLDVLRAGGNAIDAAVTIALVMGVVEPHMSGLGGDGFYHTLSGSSGKGTVYNGSGTAPACGLYPNIASLASDGPGSVSIPGAVAAIGRMHAREGTLPWSELVAPAIEAARCGFGITHVYQRFAEKQKSKLHKYELTARTFLHEGMPPAVGHFLKQEALAKSLTILAEEGADTFYRGELASRIIADMSNAGVNILASELAEYFADVQCPISTSYRGFEIRQTPPNSTGFVLLQALKIIEQFPLTDARYLSAETAHTLIEAKKLVFLDRERWAGDPRRADVPVEALLADEYIKDLASRIDPKTAAKLPVPSSPGDGNTTYFCVVDGAGNTVSAIQSLNIAFGSGVLLPNTGILLNNRMSCWHLHASHPNNLEAGMRVRHTMNAPMILKDGKIWAVFGTPGADDQVQTNLQITVGLIDFDQDPQSVVESPRWSSSQPGQDANWPHEGADSLTLETDFPAEERAELLRRGHRVIDVAPIEGPCSVECIRVLSNGSLLAASDPRRDGWAAAY